MLRRTTPSLGFEKWPWPVKLPFAKGEWYHHTTPATGAGSVRLQSRAAMLTGDALVVAFLAWAGYRAYSLDAAGAYRTRGQHLRGFPPAIIAQEFDFSDAGVAAHRQLSRAELDAYRAAAQVARADGASVESYIFKY